MKICQKSSRGITLVALVITIIILLILAGISINILIGDNGIISKVKSAREENAKSQALEELRLKVLQVQADKQGIATFQDIVDALNSDIENEYIISTKLSTITGIIPDLTNQSEFYVLYKNYWFKIDSFFNIIIISENKENIKEDTKIDLLPPPNFIPLISFTNNGTILISTDVDDSDENEENSKSGINYYEYYVSNRKIAQTKNSSFEIDVSYIEENTIIYIIAYDNANNYRESYHVNLSKTYSSLKKDYQNEIAFANNNNSSANLAFDNNPNTYWDGNNIDSYIGYDFYTPVECTNIKINQPYNTDVIRYFKIQYSDDNINYYDASDTLEYIKGNGEQLFTLYSNLGSHRFWRYKNISNYTNGSFCAISELGFLANNFNVSIDYISIDNQNATSFSNNNNNSANLAFDNNLNTYWDGKNIDSYIGYDFYAPVECTNIKINQPYNTDVIRYFKIQYSDDNINYYDASDTLEYIKGNGEQLFTLYSNLGSHRFWRYKNISNYTNDSFCAISELRFLKMY